MGDRDWPSAVRAWEAVEFHQKRINEISKAIRDGILDDVDVSHNLPTLPQPWPAPEVWSTIVDVGRRNAGPFTEDYLSKNTSVVGLTIQAIRLYNGKSRFVRAMQLLLNEDRTLTIPQIRGAANIIYHEVEKTVG